MPMTCALSSYAFYIRVLSRDAPQNQSSFFHGVDFRSAATLSLLRSLDGKFSSCGSMLNFSTCSWHIGFISMLFLRMLDRAHSHLREYLSLPASMRMERNWFGMKILLHWRNRWWPCFIADHKIENYSWSKTMIWYWMYFHVSEIKRLRTLWWITVAK